jgi:hypothetical protein
MSKLGVHCPIGALTSKVEIGGPIGALQTYWCATLLKIIVGARLIEKK